MGMTPEEREQIECDLDCFASAGSGWLLVAKDVGNIARRLLDALDAAEARIAELEAERDEARHSLYLREHGQHAEAWNELEAALDAAEARIAELEAERDADERAAGSRYLMTREDLMRAFNEKSADLARVQEQNERLVGALRSILRGYDDPFFAETTELALIAAEARAILSEVEGEK